MKHNIIEFLRGTDVAIIQTGGEYFAHYGDLLDYLDNEGTYLVWQQPTNQTPINLFAFPGVELGAYYVSLDEICEEMVTVDKPGNVNMLTSA